TESFLFQAEDGIRDRNVTGVQTCALPISDQVDGIYTGELLGDMMHGEHKAAGVRSIAVAEDIDLQSCSAYGDSANDIPMLRAVEIGRASCRERGIDGGGSGC